MALKLKLKPGERVFIKGALIRNGDSGVELELLNRVPLLREKDILLEAEADTPCKRMYLIVQTMYLDPVEVAAFTRSFEAIADEVVRAAPSTERYIEPVRTELAKGNHYAALKALRTLIQYEGELIDHAKQSQ